LVVLAALYTGWTLYSRSQGGAEADLRSKQKQAEADKKVVDAYGGDDLTILGFAADPHSVSAGGRVLMCYGVTNASKVSIDSGVESIKPSLSRCLEVFPKKTTTYTLKAEDSKGNSKTKSLTITVR
jgi:hypothetical protein